MKNLVISRTQMGWRVFGIGAVLGSCSLAFIGAGGWLTQGRLTPSLIVDRFEQNAGHPLGARRNHSKGLCVTGYFEAHAAAQAYSRATVFQLDTKIPVTGRFAIAGSNPMAADNSVPVRSLALRFELPDGQQWRSAMNAIEVFPVATPHSFYDQLLAAQPDPHTGRPDPARLQTFFDTHPDTAPFRQWIKTFTPSSSWANSSYNSLNAFVLVNSQGQRQAVRWSFFPELAYAPVSMADQSDPDFLSHDLEQRLQQGPLRWQLRFTLAHPEDPTQDATQRWPADRTQVVAGTLVLTHSQPQTEGPCRDINYDPLILPDGIEPSDDPLLSARSAVYAQSFNRRIHESAALGVTSHE